MNDKLLHTPEGVRDIYNSECKRKLKIQDEIHKILLSYGYQDIDTPSFEYFDIFNMDKGSAPSNEMYKFFDRNNNTLVLRPDITPSVARCVAKYYSDEELPIRLCYNGKTFLNAHQHQGKLSEYTQIGCEFVNDDSSAADAEIIACVISCLLKVGLGDFMIEIGHVDYFKGLMSEAGIDAETESKIREYILLKNFFGLSEFVSKLNIAENMKKAISGFDLLFGGLDMLDHALSLVSNEQSIEAINRLKKVYAALSYYGYDKYVNFDFSMINGYNYYTGVVFNGYTYGTGEPIVKGGRYNNLLSKFGKDAPSVGFAIYVDELMNALMRNKIQVDVDYSNVMIIYDMDSQENAITHGVKLRSEGKNVELIRQSTKHTIEEYINYAKKMHISSIISINKSEVQTIYSA
ncbi:MAG: ATP phosphoribosyltransferase regulatory subunit [Lachnospiraceae bacterium]|nr:ATP phosphoribosyltransferase regulatory subunit [Lachnospiraceae bacterium]